MGSGDKQKLLDLIIQAKCEDPETGSFAEWLADFLIGCGVAVNAWIPVALESPTHLQVCFVRYAFGNSDLYFYGTARYYADGGNGIVNGPHFEDEGRFGMHVTHWKEIPSLPEPPKKVCEE